MKLLNQIQRELKVPKGQYNSFAKYNYRNAEDILEAVKPLLQDGTLVISDEVINMGENRIYVKATATLQSGISMSPQNGIIEHESVSACGWAREADEKKGMDAAQITGAASSYARKYALNGLFCIDDSKDADSQETPPKAPQSAIEPKKNGAWHAPTLQEKKQAIANLLDAKAINPSTTKEEYQEACKSWTGLSLIDENVDEILKKLNQ